MFRGIILVIFVTFASITPATGAALPYSGVYTREPSVEINSLLDRLKSRDRPEEASLTLISRDDTAPYLRLALAAATTQAYKRDLAEVLRKIEAKAHERNKKRFMRWTTSRRIDLCAELLITCQDQKDVLTLIDLVLPTLHEIGAGGAARLDLPLSFPGGFQLASRFGFSSPHFANKNVTIPRNSSAVSAIIRADTCELQIPEMSGWFVTVRTELRYITDDVSNEWLHSILVVNNKAPVRTAYSSLILCDGDIKLLDQKLTNCIIIANGDIQGLKTSSIERCILCATGDIVLPGRKEVGDCVFHAGGTVSFAERPKPSDRIKEKQKSLPFGVRFLNPKEFGLELAAQNGGVQVMGIAPDSVFARYGVEDADIITAIDDVKAATLPEFRRALRAGVIRESVVLQIRRGKKQITRIVFLDGVPLPTAPPPREVKR